MRTFTDNRDRRWSIAIHVPHLKRVRAELDLDLLEVADGKLFDRLQQDPVLLCNLLYVLCRDEAEKQNVSEEAFGEALVGDAIDRATGALVEALCDFFPSRRRTILRKIHQKVEDQLEKIYQMGSDYLESDRLNRRLAAELEAVEQKLAGD